MKLDFSNVQEFEGYPTGRYHIELTDGSVEETSEESKHPENPYLNVEFTIQDGKYEGKPMYTNLMLPPYEPFMLYGLLAACGRWTKEELKSGDFDLGVDPELEGEEAAADLLEKLLELEIECIAVVSKKKGQDRTQISKFVPYDADEWEPEEDEADVLPG